MPYIPYIYRKSTVLDPKADSKLFKNFPQKFIYPNGWTEDGFKKAYPIDEVRIRKSKLPFVVFWKYNPLLAFIIYSLLIIATRKVKKHFSPKSE